MKNRAVRMLTAVIMCAVMALFCGAQGAWAENYVAELGIHAFAETLTNCTHTYLTLKNTSSEMLSFISYPIYPGEAISFSLHGDRNTIPGLGGVYINREFWEPANQPVASYYIPITQSQLDTIVSGTPQESYYHDGKNAGDWKLKDCLYHNCTTYSVRMWNKVAPWNRIIPVTGDYTFSGNLAGEIVSLVIEIDTPTYVREVIKTWEGSTYGSVWIPDNKSYPLSDVFYVTRQSELIPVEVPLPQLSVRTINNGDIDLEWNTAAERQLLYGHTNINGYRVSAFDEQYNLVFEDYRGKNNLSNGCIYAGYLQPGGSYYIRVEGIKYTSEGIHPAPAGNVRLPNDVLVTIRDRLYIDGVDMQLCHMCIFDKVYGGVSGDLSFAYWCQNRLFGVNGANGKHFGRFNDIDVYTGTDEPIEDILGLTETHGAGIHVYSGKGRSYIVMSASETHIQAAYLGRGSNVIMWDTFTWREFREMLSGEGDIVYIEFWNATGLYDPEGKCTPAAGIGCAIIKGWAVDNDDSSQPVKIIVQLGANEYEFMTHINQPELGYDGDHGFDVKLETDETGLLPLKVIACNIDEGSDTVLYEGVVEVVSTCPKYEMKIDMPDGTQAYQDRAEVYFWLVANQRVTRAYCDVGGYRYDLEPAEQDVPGAYAAYYDFSSCARAALDISQLDKGATHAFTAYMVLEDGTVCSAQSSLYVAAEAVGKAPVLHIDSPQAAAYSGTDNIEASGWIACDQEIHYGFYEVKSTDGEVGFQNGLSADYWDQTVAEANPGYTYGVRLRGVIPNGSLKPHKDYTCTFCITLSDGSSHTISQNFSMGDIPDKDTLNLVHVDAPAAGGVYSGDIEISSWVVANSPVSYCMYEIIRASDGACLGQWTLDTPDLDAADLDGEYPDYLYRRRYRGVMEIADLQSHTEYVFRIWYGIGSGGFRSNVYEVSFSTGEVKPREYAVTYDANGGFGAPQAQVKTQRETLTLSADVPSRIGRTFCGWARSKDARVPEFEPGDTYTQDAPLTLYAVWWDEQLIGLPEDGWNDFKVPVYFGGMQGWYAYIPEKSGSYRLSTSSAADNALISVYGEDGALIHSSAGLGYDASMILSMDAGKKYYISSCYGSDTAVGSYMLRISRGKRVSYTGSDDGIPVIYGWGFKYAGNPMIIARAPKKTLTVSFGVRGGTVSPDTVELADTFLGWNTKADGSGTWYEAYGEYTDEKELTLFAVWSGAALGELPVPVREGFDFMGWYHVDGTKETLAAAADVITQDETLVAGWQAKELPIDFDMNGGTGEIETIIVPYGDAFTVPKEEPERYGFRFDGWSVSPKIIVPSYLPGKTYTPTSAMTLYAVWTPPTEIEPDAKKAVFTGSLSAAGMQECFYSFTPDTTTQYRFRLAGEPDEKQLVVHLADGTQIPCAETTVDGSRVYQTYLLEAGTTYTLRACFTGSRFDGFSMIMYRGYGIAHTLGDGETHTLYCFEEQTDFALLPAQEDEVCVTLNANGGMVWEGKFTFPVTVSAWNTEMDGSGASYAPAAAYSLRQPETLYAEYTGPAVGDLGTPKRTNYLFAGWYTKREGGMKVTETTPVCSLGGTQVTLYAHWTPYDMRHIKHIDSPAESTVYPMDNHIEFTGWIVAHQEIAGAQYALTDALGNTVYEGGVIFDASAPDLDAAYSDYPYRKRMRGVINIGALEPDTEYTVSMRALLGDAQAKTEPITCVLHTGPALQIPGDVTDTVYAINGTVGGLKRMYEFTPTASARYRFTLSGALDGMGLEVTQGNAVQIPVQTTEADGSICSEYTLQAGEQYAIHTYCESAANSTGTVRVQRGWRIVYDSPFGKETQWCYAGQTDYALKKAAKSLITVKLMPNGGALASDMVSYVHEVLTWNTAQDGSGKSYAPTAVQAFAEDTTLYGMLSKVPLGKLETPVYDGFVFDGWYDEAIGGQKVTADTLVTDCTQKNWTTLYARWVLDTAWKDKIEIRFNANGGTCAISSMMVEVGSPITLPEDPVYEGYKFLGWFTDPYTGPQVYDGACFTEDFTLCARWRESNWSTAPVLHEPKIDGTTLTFTWDVEVMADRYLLCEVDWQGLITERALVKETSAVLENVGYGLRDYAVMPVKITLSGGYIYGKTSNHVTVDLAKPLVLNIPAGVREIEAYAFEESPMFTQVVMGEQVESIGAYAFRNCTGLRSITLPDSVKTFGAGIFDGCSDLVVFCSKGSAAETYCQSCSIAYELIDE